MDESTVLEATYLKCKLVGPGYKNNIELGIKFEEDDKIIFSNHFNNSMNLSQITKKCIDLLDIICDLKMKDDWELRFLAKSKNNIRFRFEYTPVLNAFTQLYLGWDKDDEVMLKAEYEAILKGITAKTTDSH